MSEELAKPKIYFASNDTLVSDKGVFDNSIDFTLRLDLEETDSVRLYCMTGEGYQTTSTTVEPDTANGAATIDKWSLAPDNAGSAGTYEDWGASLALGTVGAGAGGRVYFWARARATDDEDIMNDATVILHAQGIAEAV